MNIFFHLACIKLSLQYLYIDSKETKNQLPEMHSEDKTSGVRGLSFVTSVTQMVNPFRKFREWEIVGSLVSTHSEKFNNSFLQQQCSDYCALFIPILVNSENTISH